MATRGCWAALLVCVSLAAHAEDAAPEFKPPPGFRPKKRGDTVVYCRKEAVLGSRFPAEKCYDEAGLREIKRAELERMEMLERMRNCTTGNCSAG